MSALQLRQRGVFVERALEGLRFVVDPRSTGVAEARELVAALRERFEERAAILEYDAAYPREEAERLAWDMTAGWEVRGG